MPSHTAWVLSKLMSEPDDAPAELAAAVEPEIDPYPTLEQAHLIADQIQAALTARNGQRLAEIQATIRALFGPDVEDQIFAVVFDELAAPREVTL